MPRPDEFYEPDRILHCLQHWRCCLCERLLPGSCNRDLYQKEPGSTTGQNAERSVYKASDLVMDLYGAWAKLPWHLSRVLIGVVGLGPRDPGMGNETWRNVQIGYWQQHAMRFGRLDPSVLMDRADEACALMAWHLGWREPAEKQERAAK